jgi:hypothetical protein
MRMTECFRHINANCIVRPTSVLYRAQEVNLQYLVVLAFLHSFHRSLHGENRFRNDKLNARSPETKRCKILITSLTDGILLISISDSQAKMLASTPGPQHHPGYSSFTPNSAQLGNTIGSFSLGSGKMSDNPWRPRHLLTIVVNSSHCYV